MALINCKIHLELNLIRDCVVSAIAVTTFEITNTKLYVPIVTLSSKHNVKLVKLLQEGFERPFYWNEYQTKIEITNLDNNNLTIFLLDASFQEIRRLFVLAFNNTTIFVPNNPINNTNIRVLRNSHTKYFLTKVNQTNYSVLIDGRNVYDQPIYDLIKHYEKIRKTATRRLYNMMFVRLSVHKDHYQLIAIDLSKQKEFDADSRTIQQIECCGMLQNNSRVRKVLEKSTEATLETGTAKFL